MTLDQCEVGMRVFWDDPDNGTCSGYGKIESIKGDIVYVKKDDGGDVEVFAQELREVRKFFKTVRQITILTEDEPVSDNVELKDVAFQIDEGDWVGDDKTIESKELTGKEMADALHKAGSDPAFFMLDDEGNSENPDAP